MNRMNFGVVLSASNLNKTFFLIQTRVVEKVLIFLFTKFDHNINNKIK